VQKALSYSVPKALADHVDFIGYLAHFPTMHKAGIYQSHPSGKAHANANVKINTPGMEMERKAQWSFPIASLVALITYGDNPLMFSLRIAPKTAVMGRAQPMRELVTYVVSHINERNFLIHDLKRLFRYNAPNRTLPEHHEKDHTKTIQSQSWLKSLISLNFGRSSQT